MTEMHYGLNYGKCGSWLCLGIKKMFGTAL